MREGRHPILEGDKVGSSRASHRLSICRNGGASAEERGALLWTAQALAPSCLACCYALYKHRSGRREYEQAEHAAWRGLKEAAQPACCSKQRLATVFSIGPAT
jgi:hypothetical protein